MTNQEVGEKEQVENIKLPSLKGRKLWPKNRKKELWDNVSNELSMRHLLVHGCYEEMVSSAIIRGRCNTLLVLMVLFSFSLKYNLVCIIFLLIDWVNLYLNITILIFNININILLLILLLMYFLEISYLFIGQIQLCF